MPAPLILVLAMMGSVSAAPTDCHPAPELAAAVASGPVIAAAASAPAPSSPAHGERHRPRPPVYPDTAMVHLGPADGGTSAFVAYPPGSAPAPSIVVSHEWWGLNAQIRELARRLARQGYVAIVPDLYHGKVASDPESAHVLMRGLDEDGAVADLAAAAAWLRAGPRTAKGRVGVMGFCMGGRLAELLAFSDPQLSAAVIFYGAPEARRERVLQLQAPLQGHFGAEDQGIDTSRVEAFRTMLVGAGKTAEIYVYPGAGHAFMNQEQKSYRADAAALAWARTLAFLQKYLKGMS
jgi:carboxymethylenebutenolidase